MTYPVHIAITQGETISFEVRLVGEDLAAATPRVETDPGIPEDTVTANLVEDDTVAIRSEDTDQFAIGTHSLQVWLSWPSGDVLEEMPIEVLVVVLPRLENGVPA